MEKGSVSMSNLGSFPSPGAPNYRDNSAVSAQKGWSSERVPHPGTRNAGSRRNVSLASMTPFYSGRTLPSKWEDAERWICSPVLGYGVTKNGQHYQHQRRPRSKSGPIVPPGIAFQSSCSPAVHLLEGDGGSVRSLVVGSPFSAGVLMADGVSVQYADAGGGGQTCLAQSESKVIRSDSVPGWSDLVDDSSLPSSQDGKLEEIKDAETLISHMISQRDVATQMSPDSSSSNSSVNERALLCSHSLPVLPVTERAENPPKLEIKEVQVDKRTTTTNSFNRNTHRRIKKSLPDVENFYQNSTSACPSSLDMSEVATTISKLQREEAKIMAWENLQRAKAEAAIRKLEVRLEKKRSASMDKILNKLRMSQMKAQEMRNSIAIKQDRQIHSRSHKITFFIKHPRMRFLGSCFACHSY